MINNTSKGMPKTTKVNGSTITERTAHPHNLQRPNLSKDILTSNFVNRLSCGCSWFMALYCLLVLENSFVNFWIGIMKNSIARTTRGENNRIRKFLI